MFVVRKSDLLYIGIACGILYSILPFIQYHHTAIITILQATCLICLTCKLFLEKYNIYFLCVVLFLIVCGLYTVFVAGDSYVLINFLLILNLKNVNIEKVINCIYKVHKYVLWVSFVFFLWLLLTNSDELTYIYKGGIKRYCLLFTHSNNAAMFWGWYLVEYLYLKFSDLRVKDYTFVIIMTVVIYAFTRTDILLVIIIFAIIFCVFRNQIFMKQCVSILARYGFFILTALFLFFIYFNNNPLYDIVNAVTTGRLAMNLKAYQHFGFSLFGQQFVSTNWYVDGSHIIGYMVLDNFYIRTMIQTGVLYIVLIIIACIVYGNRIEYKKQMCILILALYGMAEHFAGNVFIMFPFIFILHCIANVGVTNNQLEAFKLY